MGKNKKSFVKPTYRKSKNDTAKSSGNSLSARETKTASVNTDSVVKEKIQWNGACAEFTVKVQSLSPIHLSSGQADVNVDAEVVHDRYGLPYFPAKRLKGLLYESAVEVKEMAELSGADFIDQNVIDEVFQHVPSEVQLVAEDLHLEGYEDLQRDLSYLQEQYPEYVRRDDVLQELTSIRYQTAINKDTGTALDGSLRNIRVVDAGLVFSGKWEIRNAGKKHLQVLALAMQNLSFAGGKRNRGFGQIQCAMAEQEMLVGQAISKGAE